MKKAASAFDHVREWSAQVAVDVQDLGPKNRRWEMKDSQGSCCAKLPSGRRRLERPDDELKRETLKKRRQRLSKMAATNLVMFILNFVRIRIILKSSLGRCTDVRRMWRLVAALLKLGASRAEVVFFLLYDMSFRDASWTANILAQYRKRRDSGAINCMRAVMQRKGKTRRSPFWKGYAAINAAHSLDKWDMQEVWRIANAVVTSGSARGEVNVDAAIELLCELPYMKAYHAYGLLRVLSQSGVGLTLSGDIEKHAQEMNERVNCFFTLLPYQNLKTHLRKHPKLKNIQIGDAALIYCETGKALVSLGILPKHRNTCPEDAKTFLTSLGARLLNQVLDQTEPLPEDVLTDAPSKQFEESKNLDDHLPRMRRRWDQEPHYCKGSEHQVSRASTRLRSHGWLRPVDEWSDDE